MIQNAERLSAHLSRAVPSLHKILPLYEESLEDERVNVLTYLDSLYRSFEKLDTVIEIEHSTEFINLLCVLKVIEEEILKDDSVHAIVRREVFKSIDIAKKLTIKVDGDVK